VKSFPARFEAAVGSKDVALDVLLNNAGVRARSNPIARSSLSFFVVFCLHGLSRTFECHFHLKPWVFMHIIPFFLADRALRTRLCGAVL
jgi:NAD(P)-dependent dehydrogenase (short-subunit alcohol dehydrogenase family)